MFVCACKQHNSSLSNRRKVNHHTNSLRIHYYEIVHSLSGEYR
ncbi:hypothetical protein XIS1_1680030 [Xenorhabdus innexi]|uniref:Uncharacterized protein n=1 Tax=Xenorhabdus innexi TaxID=290109 RepID=A0A1N6MV85_9GAMM|nr:hypothetical protein XIS1_1680030 [Xenorhabdus innexi]